MIDDEQITTAFAGNIARCCFDVKRSRLAIDNTTNTPDIIAVMCNREVRQFITDKQINNRAASIFKMNIDALENTQTFRKNALPHKPGKCSHTTKDFYNLSH